MSAKANNFKLGLFILIAVALGVCGVLVLGASRLFERKVIGEFLERHNRNIGETARDLALGRPGLEKKIAAHGLQAFAGNLRAKAGIRGPR